MILAKPFSLMNYNYFYNFITLAYSSFSAAQKMKSLNLPTYSFKIKSESRIDFIFDKCRRKYVQLTPEEWVRQNIVCFLQHERGFPVSRMVLEKSLKVHNLDKRADILVYNRSGLPVLLGECKAAGIKINNNTFLQASIYNFHFRVKYLLITNGMQHYCCSVDFNSGEVSFLEDIPFYHEIDDI